MRPGDEVRQQAAEGEGLELAAARRQLVHTRGELPAQHLRRVAAEPEHDARVEALDAPAAVVLAEDVVGLAAELGVPPAALELDDDGAAAVDDGEHLAEQGDAVGRAAEVQPAEFSPAELVHAAVHAADALQVVVVEHHHLAVRAQSHVQLHAVADAGGGVKGGDGILRDAPVHFVQAAVREIAAVEGRGKPLVPAAGGDEERERAGGGDARSAQAERELFTHRSGQTSCPPRRSAAASLF